MEKNMRPIIGLIPLYDDDKDSYWMLPGYMKVIEKCGGLPVMLPLTDDKAELNDAYKICDGILFTGGHDVSPLVYGQATTDKCGITCQLRDSMEGHLLDLCIRDDKPLLGICRGIQFINAYLGGTLYQDLPSEFDSKIEHHMLPPYEQAAHKVNVEVGTKLSCIIGPGIHEVNSYHHQAIKKLSPRVTKMTTSEDGLVEAIEIKDQRFAVAVQWHPEFSYKVCEDSIKLVQAFVDACRC
ncbi:MAG: gamma-glutamyl-gamma-aminobutyrate hydrolase family protein [Oribacterium sp.]|nr:gamma-glutamyl-gamma-aminobutyrate hydrolase family protein [Oribacterium sp.]